MRSLLSHLVNAVLFAGTVHSQSFNSTSSPNSTVPRDTYTNPVSNAYGADPWVAQDGHYYYLMYTMNTNITLLRSRTLTDWNSAESKLLYQPPKGMPYSTNLWAPEIHKLEDGHWYVIFSADPYESQPPPELDAECSYTCPARFARMYVLQSSGKDLWASRYNMKGQLESFDQFAIDGTYFKHSTGLYHIYSCWYDALQSWPANLCINKLSNPWTTITNLTQRTIISVPTNPWERTPYGRTQNERLSSNEGPEQLLNPMTGQNFLIYSAARSDNPNYCLGQLELKADGDPMNAQDWIKKNDGCVFYQNKIEMASGVGHASFVKSPDGKEDWIVYHGMKDPFLGWQARTIRAQKFTWNADGSPNFHRPGYGPYALPSGQQEVSIRRKEL